LRALDCAERHAIHDAAESALRSLAMIDWRHLRVEQSVQRLLRAREHARSACDRKIEVGSAGRLPIAMAWLGQPSGARAAVDDALRLVRETNYLVEEGLARMALVYLDVLDGSLEAALEGVAGVFFLERMTGYSWTSLLARAIVARLRRAGSGAAGAAIDEWTSTQDRRTSRADVPGAQVLAGQGRRDGDVTSRASTRDRQHITVHGR
jgi:hypothetical protein